MLLWASNDKWIFTGVIGRPLHVLMFQERVLHFYYDIFILDVISQEHFIELGFLIGMTNHSLKSHHILLACKYQVQDSTKMHKLSVGCLICWVGKLDIALQKNKISGLKNKAFESPIKIPNIFGTPSLFPSVKSVVFLMMFSRPQYKM